MINFWISFYFFQKLGLNLFLDLEEKKFQPACQIVQIQPTLSTLAKRAPTVGLLWFPSFLIRLSSLPEDHLTTTVHYLAIAIIYLLRIANTDSYLLSCFSLLHRYFCLINQFSFKWQYQYQRDCLYIFIMDSYVPGPVRKAPPPPPRKAKNLPKIESDDSFLFDKKASVNETLETEKPASPEDSLQSELKNSISVIDSKGNKVIFESVVNTNPIPIPCRKDSLASYKCGYLGKLTGHQKSLGQFFGQLSSKSLSRQRWMVLSERSCRLLYYKREGDTQPLGEINIAAATFNYNPEDQDGSFTITWDNFVHYDYSILES